VLIEEPLCRVCKSNGHLTPGTQVDHILAKALGGLDDRTNLQSICGPCHADKTQLDVQKMRRGYQSPRLLNPLLV
jgi:5-methylcytosine-specific restriction protein A